MSAPIRETGLPAETAAPFVSVVVPVRNGERTIGECLTALLRAEYPPDRREILVVDNGSTDRTVEIVGRFPVQFIRANRDGVAAARNGGIEAARGEIVAFTDADCLVTTRWLRELLQPFQNPGVGVVVGEVVAYPPRTPAERYRAKRRPLHQLHALRRQPTPWFSVGNAAVRREVFERIGLFDLSYPQCEDIEFSWRVFNSKRFTVVYWPTALAFHRLRTTTRELFRQYRGYGFSQALLISRHRGTLVWDWRRELSAHRDLLATGLAVAREGLRMGRKGVGTSGFSQRYCELVLKVGERIGFIQGIYRVARRR